MNVIGVVASNSCCSVRVVREARIRSLSCWAWSWSSARSEPRSPARASSASTRFSSSSRSPSLAPGDADLAAHVLAADFGVDQHAFGAGDRVDALLAEVAGERRIELEGEHRLDVVVDSR